MQKCVPECHSRIIYHSPKVEATRAHQLVGGQQKVDSHIAMLPANEERRCWYMLRHR